MAYRPETDSNISTFAVKLLQGLNGVENGDDDNNNNNNNLVVSPLAAMSGMLMTLLGADGRTLSQMLNLLFDEDIYNRDVAKEHFDKFVRRFTENVEVNQDLVSVANLAYFRQGVQLSSQYESYLQRLKVNAKILDFANSAYCQKTIVADLEEALNVEKFENILNIKTVAGDCSVLVSVIKFSAQWDTHFDGRQTKRDGLFRLDTGDNQTVRTVMMHDYNPRAFFEDDFNGTKAVSLDYRTQFNYSIKYYCRVPVSMVLILPRDGVKMQHFIQNFSGTMLDAILSKLDDAASSDFQVSLTVPRFKLRGEVDGLKAALQALNLGEAFDPERADLSNITADPVRLFVSQLKHSAQFGIDESGSLASDPAPDLIPDASADPRTGKTVEFKADRPFLYAVVHHTEPKQILFIGVFNKPSQ